MVEISAAHGTVYLAGKMYLHGLLGYYTRSDGEKFYYFYPDGERGKGLNMLLPSQLQTELQQIAGSVTPLSQADIEDRLRAIDGVIDFNGLLNEKYGTIFAALT